MVYLRIFHVHLWRMCILLFWSRMLYRCLLYLVDFSCLSCSRSRAANLRLYLNTPLSPSLASEAKKLLCFNNNNNKHSILI